jgi:hypothetical protein
MAILLGGWFLAECIRKTKLLPLSNFRQLALFGLKRVFVGFQQSFEFCVFGHLVAPSMRISLFNEIDSDQKYCDYEISVFMDYGFIDHCGSLRVCCSAV